MKPPVVAASAEFAGKPGRGTTCSSRVVIGAVGDGGSGVGGAVFGGGYGGGVISYGRIDVGMSFVAVDVAVVFQCSRCRTSVRERQRQHSLGGMAGMGFDGTRTLAHMTNRNETYIN